MFYCHPFEYFPFVFRRYNELQNKFFEWQCFKGLKRNITWLFKFLKIIPCKCAIKICQPQAVLIGEVWEEMIWKY